MIPFHGEKGTTWEGGFRIPMLARWPGVIKPGTQCNEIISLIDWFPTLSAAAGIPDIKEKMAAGWTGAGTTFKVHLDGYNFLPYFQGKSSVGPRDSILYFDQGGSLNAIRWSDWKLSFACIEGNIATGTRTVTNWPLVWNLRMDPCERGFAEGGENTKFAAGQMWLLIPIQGKIKDFLWGLRKVSSSGGEFPYCFQHRLRVVAAG